MLSVVMLSVVALLPEIFDCCIKENTSSFNPQQNYNVKAHNILHKFEGMFKDYLLDIKGACTTCSSWLGSCLYSNIGLGWKYSRQPNTINVYPRVKLESKSSQHFVHALLSGHQGCTICCIWLGSCLSRKDPTCGKSLRK
jgi:hypothetical protein